MSTEYPMCEKLAASRDKSLAIKDFIDWLHEERDATLKYQRLSKKERTAQKALGTYNMQCIYSSWIPDDIEKLLAEYFEIDMDIVENERRAMLDKIRKENSKTS